MRERCEGLVYRLERDKIRFTEFKRVAADDTITSALAGILLGGGKKTMKKDSSFSASTQALPWLWKFYNDIEAGMGAGRIVQTPGESPAVETPRSPTRYAPRAIAVDDEVAQDILDQMPSRDVQSTTGAAIPATWNGVQSRLDRYLAFPVYGWEQFGLMDLNRELGYKEARRQSRQDKRCCDDCLSYDAMGWQPIGILPPPGQRCVCHDRCRCVMDYR